MAVGVVLLDEEMAGEGAAEGAGDGVALEGGADVGSLSVFVEDDDVLLLDALSVIFVVVVVDVLVVGVGVALVSVLEVAGSAGGTCVWIGVG